MSHDCLNIYEFGWQNTRMLQGGNNEQLIREGNVPSGSSAYFVTIDDPYDVIGKGHVATGFGGRDRMFKYFCIHTGNWGLHVAIR